MNDKYAIVKILDGGRNDAPLLSVFLARFIERNETQNCAGTMKNERAATREFLEFAHDQPICELSPAIADSWRTVLLKRYAQNSARLKLGILKAAFNYAVAIKLLLENPFKSVSLPKATFAGRFVSDRELRRFFKFLKHPIARRAVRLCLFTGMRPKEATSLLWEEVKKGFAIIPPHKSKNRRERIVFLNAQARRCLGPRRTGRVFLLSKSYINKLVLVASQKSGCARIRWHDMRHTAAAKHQERNHDDSSMLPQFGWVGEKSALPYRHILDRRVKKAMDRVTFRL